jgi:CBS domain-containing protein
MIRLRDIMTTDVLTVAPELSIREAMELLASRHVSGAPVVAGGDVVGVVSATDLMSFAAALPGVPTEREQVSAPDDWQAPEEWEEGGDPPGSFFTEMWDDAGVDAETRFDALDSPEWNSLEEHTVSEVMTRSPVCALAPHVSVPEGADFMQRAGVHRVLVMEGDQLVGIVTTTDIARAVAEHKLTSRTFVFGAPTHVDGAGFGPISEA